MHGLEWVHERDGTRRARPRGASSQQRARLGVARGARGMATCGLEQVLSTTGRGMNVEA